MGQPIWGGDRDKSGVKEAKIVKARDTPDAACILLTVEVSSKK